MTMTSAFSVEAAGVVAINPCRPRASDLSALSPRSLVSCPETTAPKNPVSQAFCERPRPRTAAAASSHIRSFPGILRLGILAIAFTFLLCALAHPLLASHGDHDYRYHGCVDNCYPHTSPPPFPVLPATFKARLLITFDTSGRHSPWSTEGDTDSGAVTAVSDAFVLLHHDASLARHSGGGGKVSERQRVDFFHGLNDSHLGLFFSAIQDHTGRSHYVYHRQARSPAMCVELGSGGGGGFEWYRSAHGWSPRYFGRARYLPPGASPELRGEAYRGDEEEGARGSPCDHWRLRHPLAMVDLDLCVEPGSLRPLIVECLELGIRLDVLALHPPPLNGRPGSNGSAARPPQELVLPDSLFDAQLVSAAPCAPLG